MEKWIIFDVMGVIFEAGDDTNDLLVPFIQKKNKAVTSEKINSLYVKASLGTITSFEFWDALNLGAIYPQIEQEYLDSYLTLDKNFIKVAEQLSADYSLAILSNDVQDWSNYLRYKFDLNRLFKSIVISGEVKYRKPATPIYEILLTTMDCKPEKCIFIDDRIKNLKPAAELGMKTIWLCKHPIETDYYADGKIKNLSELIPTISKLHAK